MRDKMKRDGGDFFFEKCLRTLQPATWISPKCFRTKSLSDELFLHFSSKVQNLTVFSIIYMIRIRFFGPGEFIQNGFSDEQYVFDIESICIHGKEDSENVRTVKNAGENLTLKQMFEISEQLKLEQLNEIFLECVKSAWKFLHGNNYLWLMMKKSSVSRMQRFMYSQILCDVLERWIKNQNQILLGKKMSWFKSSPQYRTLDTSDGEPMEFEWCIFPRITTCRCSMTSFCELKTMNRNALLMPHLCLYLQKDFQQDVGHSSDLDQKRSSILLTTEDHEQNGTESLN